MSIGPRIPSKHLRHSKAVANVHRCDASIHNANRLVTSLVRHALSPVFGLANTKVTVRCRAQLLAADYRVTFDVQSYFRVDINAQGSVVKSVQSTSASSVACEQTNSLILL